MRTEYIPAGDLTQLLDRMTPTTRLICEVCLETGLRVGDVVALRRKDLSETMTVRESKTGKKRTVTLPGPMVAQLRKQAGRRWVFPGAWDVTKHRTRQSVWQSIKRAARALELPENAAPHSLRKVYAVGQLDATGGNLGAVQRDLGHDRMDTTLLYAMARELYRSKYGGGDGDSGSGARDDTPPGL